MTHRNHGQNWNQTQIVINHNPTSIMLIVIEKHGRLALAAGAPSLPICTGIRWSGAKCRLFTAGLKLDFRYYISSKGWDTILNLIKMRDCHAQITTKTSWATEPHQTRKYCINDEEDNNTLKSQCSHNLQFKCVSEKRQFGGPCKHLCLDSTGHVPLTWRETLFCFVPHPTGAFHGVSVDLPDIDDLLVLCLFWALSFDQWFSRLHNLVICLF